MVDNPLNRLLVKRGSDLPQAKLDEHKVREILHIEQYRKELDRQRALLTNKKIAELYNVHESTVEKALSGFTWAHVVGV